MGLLGLGVKRELILSEYEDIEGSCEQSKQKDGSSLA